LVYPLLGVGDGPMLAALANSLGPKASFSCVYGQHGGTMEWKRSYEGILSAIQVSGLIFGVYLHAYHEFVGVSAKDSGLYQGCCHSTT
jgi:hypothetical protein